ncbi:MAG: hypothetical protein AABX23_01260 [Nanoarchaeota archaeon]
MDFSNDIAKLYSSGPASFDPRILPFILRLKDTPDLAGIMLGREFTHRAQGNGMRVHEYNPFLRALEVSVFCGGYGRRVLLKMPEEKSGRAINYLKNQR